MIDFFQYKVWKREFCFGWKCAVNELHTKQALQKNDGFETANNYKSKSKVYVNGRCNSPEILQGHICGDRKTDSSVISAVRYSNSVKFEKSWSHWNSEVLLVRNCL